LTIQATLEGLEGSLLLEAFDSEDTVRKQIGMIVLLMIVLLTLGLTGCGSSSSSSNINGTWMATLNDVNGSPVYSFSTTFTQGSGSSVSVTNFTFTSAGSCFASDQTTETATFGLMGNFNGNVTGTFEMTITTMFPGATNNVLTLQGTVNGNTISGTWMLTGLTGCSGNGNFTIHGVPPV
jgi:hypothetical protein